MNFAAAAAPPPTAMAAAALGAEPDAERKALTAAASRRTRRAGPKGPDLGRVTARKNLNETAFFFPNLSRTRRRGEAQFTMPEALTQWRFMGFAHDASAAPLPQGKTVTAKDLMVQQTAAFLREGDTLSSMRVSNPDGAREGRMRLTFERPRRAKPSCCTGARLQGPGRRT
jgi:uncharacterized protein YfaS (alpha-2-macroglobulin family)